MLSTLSVLYGSETSVGTSSVFHLCYVLVLQCRASVPVCKMGIVSLNK